VPHLTEYSPVTVGLSILCQLTAVSGMLVDLNTSAGSWRSYVGGRSSGRLLSC
jgi:hypothetical protein